MVVAMGYQSPLSTRCRLGKWIKSGCAFAIYSIGLGG